MPENSTNNRRSLVIAALCGLVWLCVTAEWFYMDIFPDIVRVLGIGLTCVASGIWLYATRRETPRQRAIAGSLSYVVWWQFLVLIADFAGMAEFRVVLAQVGLGGLFLIGLAWVVWALERASREYEIKRIERLIASGRADEAGELPPERIWHPLDPSAWYYGRKSRKLNQSVAALIGYTFSFFMAFLLLTQTGGCQELYELPAGGGKTEQITQVVKVQKIIKKKFVINPFSNISFNPPPIDDIKLALTELTQHQYKIGDGEGDGAGYSGGTGRGKVRFIRLEYTGGDWNQDFGVGADLNMLNEYGIRTGQKTHDTTESRTVAQLKNFPMGKSPPMVYMTGQRNISLSDNEVKILREYLLEKHGMIFGDNGGSRHFHNQFVAMMNRVLENKVEPVPVPLDDVIHLKPYPLPFLPFVAPHGGKEALGWKVDGRWVCYYHPGDIGDAWADDHAGVRREVAEFCYQLGTNVIAYANAEYNKWVQAQKKK